MCGSPLIEKGFFRFLEVLETTFDYMMFRFFTDKIILLLGNYLSEQNISQAKEKLIHDSERIFTNFLPKNFDRSDYNVKNLESLMIHEIKNLSSKWVGFKINNLEFTGYGFETTLLALHSIDGFSFQLSLLKGLNNQSKVSVMIKGGYWQSEDQIEVTNNVKKILNSDPRVHGRFSIIPFKEIRKYPIKSWFGLETVSEYKISQRKLIFAYFNIQKQQQPEKNGIIIPKPYIKRIKKINPRMERMNVTLEALPPPPKKVNHFNNMLSDSPWLLSPIKSIKGCDVYIAQNKGYSFYIVNGDKSNFVELVEKLTLNSKDILWIEE